MQAYQQGKRALDPTSDRWIPYQSYSDALIAQLSLSRGFTSMDVDLVLEIIHDPAFDPKEVSFQKTADIYVPVAEDRESAREASLRALSMPNGSLETAGMSHTILDLVVHHIEQEVLVTIGKHYGPFFDECEWMKTLEQMTMVHRSWARPVLHAHRRFLVIDDKHMLDGQILHSVRYGPWTRELSYAMRPGTTSPTTTKLVPWTNWNTFTSLLLRSPDLKVLMIESTGRYNLTHGPERVGILSAFAAIGTLQRLQRLSVHSEHTNAFFLTTAMCLALPKLENFSFLYIDNRCFEEIMPGDDCPPKSFCRDPPASLKRVVLRLPFKGIMPSQYLSWLLRPRGDFAVETLMVLYEHQDEIAHALPTFSAVFDAGPMHGLSVVEIQQDPPCWHHRGELVQFSSIFSNLIDLTTLRLRCTPFGLATLAALPKSLEGLRVRKMQNYDIDAILSKLIISNDLRFENLWWVGVDEEKRSAPTSYPLTRQVCIDRGIKFILFGTSSP